MLRKIRWVALFYQVVFKDLLFYNFLNPR